MALWLWRLRLALWRLRLAFWRLRLALPMSSCARGAAELVRGTVVGAGEGARARGTLPAHVHVEACSKGAKRG